MVEMQANERNELSSAEAGDIIAIVGMKTYKPATLCVTLNTNVRWKPWCSQSQ